MNGARAPRNYATANRESGFSLLEVVVAFTIATLAITIIGVSFARSSAGMRFDDSVQHLVLALKEAQTRSLRSGRDVALVLDIDERTFAVGDGPSVALPADVGLRVIFAYESSTVERNPAFVFSPDGGATGGSIELLEQERTTAIWIDWLTGSIRLTHEANDARSN